MSILDKSKGIFQIILFGQNFFLLIECVNVRFFPLILNNFTLPKRNKVAFHLLAGLNRTISFVEAQEVVPLVTLKSLLVLKSVNLKLKLRMLKLTVIADLWAIVEDVVSIFLFVLNLVKSIVKLYVLFHLILEP